MNISHDSGTIGRKLKTYMSGAMMDENTVNPGADPAYLLRDEMGNGMLIDIWYEGEVWVFRPSGKIDTGRSVDLDVALSEGIGQGMRQIVIDFADTIYISSSGLRAIIKAGKMVKPGNGSIRICGMNNAVYEVFKLSGLLSIFPSYETSCEAVGSFNIEEKRVK